MLKLRKINFEILEGRRLLAADLGLEVSPNESLPEIAPLVSWPTIFGEGEGEHDHGHDHSLCGCPRCQALATAFEGDDSAEEWDTGTPQPITHVVTVQPIIVSNSDGSNTAGYFGTDAQEAIIHDLIDQVWAQAGIDIAWLEPNFWNNSFANVGSSSPRPQSDLDWITNNGDRNGKGNSDSLVLDMYFVEVAAGFAQQSNNVANGLAYVGGNGSTLHVGDSLVTWTEGRQVAARVVAHEIGHNLGLGHVIDEPNLMDDGALLNASQISTSLASQFAIPNAAPTVAAPLADVTVEVNGSNTQVNLSGVFNDANGDTLTYTVASNNPSIVSSSVNGSTLTLSYPAGITGTTTVTVTATDEHGSQVSDSFELTVIDPNQVSFVANVDGDNQEDYVTWSAGSWRVVKAPQTTTTEQQFAYWSPDGNWDSLGVGDFNGDGRDDVIGRSGGNWWVGISDGNSFSGQLWGYWSPSLTWLDITIGDFNGDGLSDIAGRTSGQWWVAESTGTSFSSSYWGYWPPSLNWENVTFGDFTGDGRQDVAGQINGHWWIGASTGSAFVTDFWTYWSTSVTWTDISVGDFNGDGRDDLAGRVDGQWWVGISTGSSFNNQHWGYWNPAQNWEQVRIGDFNSDGRDDLIARVGNSWYYAAGGASSFTNFYWGEEWSSNPITGYLSGDFDGDGQDDLLAWYESSIAVRNT